MIEPSRAAILMLMRSAGRQFEAVTAEGTRMGFRGLIEEDQLIALDDTLRPDRRARYKLTLDARRAPVLDYGDIIEMLEPDGSRTKLKITAIRRVPTFGVAQYDAILVE